MPPPAASSSLRCFSLQSQSICQNRPIFKPQATLHTIGLYVGISQVHSQCFRCGRPLCIFLGPANVLSLSKQVYLDKGDGRLRQIMKSNLLTLRWLSLRPCNHKQSVRISNNQRQIACALTRQRLPRRACAGRQPDQTDRHPPILAHTATSVM